MADNARRVSLRVNTLKNNVITEEAYSLVSYFAVNNVIYHGITSSEVLELSDVEYEERVVAFLDYLEITNEEIRNRLIDEAQFYSPECDPIVPDCELNTNFSVGYSIDNEVLGTYRISVSNIGTAYGITEFTVYEFGSESTEWKRIRVDNVTQQFYNLAPGGEYVVEIRDNYINEIICTKTKTITLPTS